MDIKTVKVRYAGTYPLFLLTNWSKNNQDKVINIGDILDVPADIWEVELKGSKRWQLHEEVIPIVESKKSKSKSKSKKREAVEAVKEEEVLEVVEEEVKSVLEDVIDTNEDNLDEIKEEF